MCLFASFEQESNKKPITIHNNAHLKFGFSVEHDSEFWRHTQVIHRVSQRGMKPQVWSFFEKTLS